jgi:hypothetical protein
VDDERTVIHSIALFTQGMAFRSQRSRMLKLLNWTAVEQREMELIKDVVLTQARFTLEGLARQRQGEACRVSKLRYGSSTHGRLATGCPSARTIGFCGFCKVVRLIAQSFFDGGQPDKRSGTPVEQVRPVPIAVG